MTQQPAETPAWSTVKKILTVVAAMSGAGSVVTGFAMIDHVGVILGGISVMCLAGASAA